MLSVTCLRNHADLQSLHADWQRLAAGSLFSDWAWLVNWANNYVPAHELCVLVARDDAQGVAAILPLYREVSLVRGRTLRFLGSGKVCTEYQTVLSTNHVTLAETAVRAIGDWLSQTGAQSEIEWDLMELESSSPDDMAMGWLMHELGQRGLSVQSQAAPCCWKVALKPTWDEYLEGLDKNVRRKIRKLVRDYVDTGRAELRVRESYDERQVAMQHLIEFHQRRWQDVGVEGCFSQPEFGQFLRQAVEGLAASGRVWLGQLSVDHQPVAVSLFLRHAASEFALYQCGMNIEARDCQPGWLSNVLNLQRMIEQGGTACDYLRGDERYKRELGAEPVPMITYAVAAPHVAGRLRSAVVQTEKWLKDWGRQFLQNAESRAN